MHSSATPVSTSKSKKNAKSSANEAISAATGTQCSEKPEAQKLAMVEYVVSKRVSNLDYIRRVHEGTVFWMNIVRVSTDDIVKSIQPQLLQKRVQQWFHVGMSLAPLLQLDSGWQFIRACAQLMEEFEYHFSSVAMQGMKMLKALTVGNEEDRNVKPHINKIGGNVVYEFLRTPNIPCELDYCQVVLSLCDILTFVYRKFMDDSNVSAMLFENVVKLDAKFKHHFFGQISRDLNALSSHLIKLRITKLENMLGVENDSGTEATETGFTIPQTKEQGEQGEQEEKK